MSTLLKSLTGLLLAAGMLAANSAGAADRMSIPFADLGSIRDWHSEDSEELYVQNQNRDWYRITFWSPCFGLPFATGIAFVTDSIGALDKYSSILVDGERCYFRTFEASEAPPEEVEDDEEDRGD